MNNGVVTLDHISDRCRIVFQWVLFTCVCQAIDIFGIVSNIINIVCFVQQGFQDSVNVSLLGLTLSDIGCLLTLIWTNIFLTPPISSATLPFDTIEFQYLTGALLHAAFSRVTCWITALVTLERCLCITAPLKVKSLITPRIMSIIIASLFTILLSSVAPVYVVNRLGPKFVRARNITLLGLVYADNHDSVEKVSFAVNNVAVPFTAFVIIIVCTVTIVITLKKQSAWRNKSMSEGQGFAVSNRNQKVAKMIVMISGLFVACFTPLGIMFVVLSLEPRYAVDGEFRNTSIVISGFGLILESINSSVNIFIYYHMSSNYQRTFNKLFSVNNTINKNR